MNGQFRTYRQAFIDGFVTGADIFGTVWGHFSGDERFSGYQADKYSRADSVPPQKGRYVAYQPVPKRRDVLEQSIKGVGDVIGALSNIPTLFLPQIMFLGEVCCKDQSIAENWFPESTRFRPLPA